MWDSLVATQAMSEKRNGPHDMGMQEKVSKVLANSHEDAMDTSF